MSSWLGSDPTELAPGAVVRLFCFAYAGGGTAFFRPWRFALAPEIEVRPVLLPGRESRIREEPYRRMEWLIDPLCNAIAPYLRQPYAFFGHSLGSLLAFEVARRTEPRALLVSGRRGPYAPATHRDFHRLPEAEFIQAVGSLNGTPPEVLAARELLRVVLPTLRADFELNETYVPLPGGSLSCPVTAYVGDVDPEVTIGEMVSWRTVTDAEFSLRVFAGDHFYLKGGRSDVLSAVRQDLRRVLIPSAAELSQPLLGGVHAQSEA